MAATRVAGGGSVRLCSTVPMLASTVRCYSTSRGLPAELLIEQGSQWGSGDLLVGEVATPVPATPPLDG